MNRRFEVGDMVYLPPDGPLMMVSRIVDLESAMPDYECVWFAKDEELRVIRVFGADLKRHVAG